MEQTTTSITIDDILNDPAAAAACHDDSLPIATRVAAEVAAKTAYFMCRARAESVADAKEAAQAAFEKAVHDATLAAADAAIAKADKALARTAGAVVPAAMVPGVSAQTGANDDGPRPENRQPGAEHVSAGGEARSKGDLAAAIASGFAPAETLYRRGTRVIQLGVDNARAARLEHEAKPLVGAYCDEFVAKIASENRRIVKVEKTALSMTSDGRITNVEAAPLAIEYDAFGALVSRLGYGGAKYLGKCRTPLRAHNFNEWRARLELEAEADEATAPRDGGTDDDRAASTDELAMRVRDTAGGGARIFAAVTPKYSPFDGDRIAQAIKRATPEDARGTVAYDGKRARFEVLFHSNVQPEHYVAGEFFKAGVIIRSDDTGGGSVKVNAIVWQNLCLNLIVIDECSRDLLSLRHVGSVFELAKKFEAGYKRALESLEHFLKAWGYACTEDVVARVRAATEEAVPTRAEEVLPGLFNGILDAKLVELPGAATTKKRAAIIDALVEKWRADESGAKLAHGGITRAAIVNAFTRWAHEDLPAEDPWAEDEIQRAAGALLWGSKPGKAPAPLPYLELDAEAAVDAAKAGVS